MAVKVTRGAIVVNNLSVLTSEQRESGEWINEAVARKVSGLSLQSLRDKRQKGSLTSLPESRGPSGSGRSFWYFRADVEALARRRSTKEVPRLSRSTRAKMDESSTAHLMRELEVAMLRAETKELEVARARAEAQVEITRLSERLDAALQREKIAEGRVRDLTAELQRIRRVFAISIDDTFLYRATTGADD